MSMFHPTAALVLAIAMAAPAQATSSLNRSHAVYAESQHCCWDVRFNIASDGGSGQTYSTASWGSQAAINGSVGYRQLTASASAATDITSFVYGNAIAEARDYWVDTFHIQSDTLANGTPVLLSLGVYLDASVNTSSAGKGYVLAVIGTGLDAGWRAGVDTRVVGSGQHSSFGTLETSVGATITLVGQMNTRAWAELSNGPVKAATSQVSGASRFTVASLTDGAWYMASTGLDYTAPVPEPGTWALMLGGAALLAMRRHRARPA